MKVLPLVAAALSLSACAFASTAALAQDAQPSTATHGPVKNIVLVHGAWVGGAGWKPVYEILTKDGYHVSIVQEPLTSLEDDVAATNRVLDLQTGPTILVGHSYGGSIITEAGENPNVVGLVYVAAHAPAVGENESALGKGMPSVTSKQTGAIEKTADGYTYLNPDDYYKDFAADLPAKQAQFEAHEQMLTAAKVFTAPITAAAWTTKPSWGIVAADDKIINPDLERWYYARAHSHTTVLQGASHSVYESRPKDVAAVIEAAAKQAQG
ncbi:alpha/beta hydrolase [Paraburkholderia sp.]|uniref:alpha/beta hydrolase n=1 Tax=Paraburkholderia sp. TaxID=1926495 RepID=UPI00238B6217|nr:alpha/beta hydrolase [Paraburkholderia sp.]MDE1184251.1 alpha/beta hydrolase [Paraburkholderia sp.]